MGGCWAVMCGCWAVTGGCWAVMGGCWAVMGGCWAVTGGWAVIGWLLGSQGQLNIGSQAWHRSLDIKLACHCQHNRQTHTHFKATFSFHQIIPQYAQMTTLYSNLSLYITFTMIYYI